MIYIFLARKRKARDKVGSGYFFPSVKREKPTIMAAYCVRVFWMHVCPWKTSNAVESDHEKIALTFNRLACHGQPTCSGVQTHQTWSRIHPVDSKVHVFRGLECRPGGKGVGLDQTVCSDTCGTVVQELRWRWRHVRRWEDQQARLGGLPLAKQGGKRLTSQPRPRRRICKPASGSMGACRWKKAKVDSPRWCCDTTAEARLRCTSSEDV